MNKWRARLQMWLLITVFMILHGHATGSLPNSPAGMLVFHGSAALLDWLLLMVSPALLCRRLCGDMQWLFLASIVGNAGGWILYMIYAPPSLYNVFMWGLTVAQWLRLVIPDRHDANSSWLAVVLHRDRVGGG